MRDGVVGRILHLLIDDSHISSEGEAIFAPNVIPIKFKDTWRVGVGANYILNSAIKFRSGIAYDESPVQDEYRLIMIPDSDRLDLSLGMGIAPRSWKKTRLDIAYMHTFFAAAPVTQTNLLGILNSVLPLPDNAGNVNGEFDSAVDYIGIQIVRGM